MEFECIPGAAGEGTSMRLAPGQRGRPGDAPISHAKAPHREST